MRGADGDRAVTRPGRSRHPATQDWWGTEEACVRYGDKLALDHVTFRAMPGRVSAVVGGDGAGRTTLLRCLAGALAVTSGQVRLPPPLRIGYLSAGSGTYPDLSVDENLAFRATAYQVPATLPGSAAPNSSSGPASPAPAIGWRDGSPAGCGRSSASSPRCCTSPTCWCWTKPTTGVDPVSRADLWWLIAQAAATGAAVVFATSYLDEAERALDVLALDVGRELASGTPEEIIEAMPGTLRVSDARPEGDARRRAWRRLLAAGGSGTRLAGRVPLHGFASPESGRNGRDHDANP